MLFQKQLLSILLLGLSTGLTPLWGQAPGFEKQKNEAIAALRNYPNPDTARVNALLAIVHTATFLKERKELSPYRAEAMALSRQLNYTEGIALCYLSEGTTFKSASDYATALVYYDSALLLVQNSREPMMIEIATRVHDQVGQIYHIKQHYHAALDHFLQVLQHSGPPDSRRNVRINIYLTDIYSELGNYEKATEYALRNIAIVERDSTNVHRESVYLAFIEICLARKDYEMANTYLDLLGKVIPKPKEVQVNFGYYLKRGHLNFALGKYTVANMYYKEAYKQARLGGHKSSINTALQRLSATAIKLGELDDAGRYALENLELAEQINRKAEKMDALMNLSDYHSSKGNSAKALELMKEAMILKDSIVAENTIRQVNILGAVYEADKKEKEIARLQQERLLQESAVQKKSMLNKVFIGAIVALLLLGYLIYRNFRNKQMISRQEQVLQKQRITELEKDKHLMAADAMLKGQEEERARIAKDLHDGLGSLLYGTKLSFLHLKDQLNVTPQQHVQFEKSLSMLDNTIGDLRKVAQNLMPEALVKFGLHEAIRDLCEFIQSTTGIEVLFQQFGEKRKLDSAAEVFVFRMIQELINNAIKHSGASQVLVQITDEENRTGITVEDNGVGFDTNGSEIQRGVGMTSIRHRVAYFNGTLDIVSEPGKGTSVNVII